VTKISFNAGELLIVIANEKAAPELKSGAALLIG